MPSNENPKVNIQLEQTIKALLADRPVAYHAMLARAVGSVTAGVFLSQFLYWTPRSQNREGWIYKTQDEIYSETGLTRWEQETARTKLRESGRFDNKKGKDAKLGGVLEEKLAGVPSRLYYRVNMAALISLLNKQEQSDEEERPVPKPDEPISEATSYDVETPHPTMPETANPSLGSGNPTHKDGGKPHPIYVSENTTENTVNVSNGILKRIKDLDQPKDKTVHIAQHILGQLGDLHSEKFYLLVAAKVPEQIVRKALSEIRVDGARNPAKVFTYRMNLYAQQALGTG